MPQACSLRNGLLRVRFRGARIAHGPGHVGPDYLVKRTRAIFVQHLCRHQETDLAVIENHFDGTLPGAVPEIRAGADVEPLHPLPGHGVNDIRFRALDGETAGSDSQQDPGHGDDLVVGTTSGATRIAAPRIGDDSSADQYRAR